MTELPSAPEVEPDFGGQLWPTESPSSENSPSGSPTRSGSPSRRRPFAIVAFLVLLLAVGVAAFVVAGSRAPGSQANPGPSSDQAQSRASNDPIEGRPVDAPTGFAAYEEFDGVKTFTHSASGFTVSLAPGWRLIPDAKLDKNTLLMAGDAKPSYNLAATGGASPLMMLYTYRYGQTLAPPRFFQNLRQTFAGQDRTVGEVRMTVGLVEAGRAFVLRFTQEVSGVGLVRYSMYSVVRNDRVYQVAFSVPADRAAEYQPIFSKMARTIAFRSS